MKTILTPVDFSPATSHVIDAAIELAHAVNGKVVLLHANQPPTVTADYGLAVENVQEIVSVTEKASNQQLEHLLRKLSDRGVDATTVSLNGSAVATIVAQARQLEASYIVMGSHGHTALYDLLVGSTTHGVLKKSPCPVVIVPPESAGE
jgi:nucleotide-binding universal stress UspA family protein